MSKHKKSKSRSSGVYAVKIAQSLPSRPKDAVAYICEAFATWHESNSDPASLYGEYLGFFALLNMHSENLAVNLPAPKLKGNHAEDIQLILEYFSNMRHQLALMTLDLTLLANLSRQQSQDEPARFYKLSKDETSAINTATQQLIDMFGAEDIPKAAMDQLQEKFTILQEQLEHAIVDLDLAWRFISQMSVTMDALEKQGEQGVKLLRDLTESLWRIQAREDKLPESTLKSILLKLTNPARWEEESAASKQLTGESDASPDVKE